VLVVDGRCGTGEVIDLVYLQVDGIDDVVAKTFEMGVGQEVEDVFLAARVEVVEAKDIMALGQKTFAEMGAEKAGAACDEDSLHLNHCPLDCAVPPGALRPVPELPFSGIFAPGLL